MLDIKMLRASPTEVRAALGRRGNSAALEAFDHALSLDEERRRIIACVEELKARRNEVSRKIGDLKRKGTDASELIASMQGVAERIRALDSELMGVEGELDSALLNIPNRPSPRVPAGGEGEVLGGRGDPPDLPFEPRPHWELAASLGILDLERGARIAGSGFPLFVGAGARLTRVLIDFMLELHVEEHGYVEVAPPLLVTRNSLIGTGQLPKFEEDVYHTAADDLFLVPTAEVPVTNLHRDEIIDGSTLPLAYVAYTPCFRREAGAAGRDTRGLLRVHQFDKVELVRFTTPEDSDAELERLTRHAERVLELLGLPYRRILLPAGELGFSSAIQYDLEVWSAGVGKWLEVSSCSSFMDYQARRAGIRYRPADGKRPRFVHTLNGSGVALARTIAAILENNQEADGSVWVPEVLRSRMGMERLEAP
ncbi:MAG: serine--tRNA ligase [Gemmatimonadota bacterium]